MSGPAGRPHRLTRADNDPKCGRATMYALDLEKALARSTDALPYSSVRSVEFQATSDYGQSSRPRISRYGEQQGWPSVTHIVLSSRSMTTDATVALRSMGATASTGWRHIEWG